MRTQTSSSYFCSARSFRFVQSIDEDKTDFDHRFQLVPPFFRWLSFAFVANVVQFKSVQINSTRTFFPFLHIHLTRLSAITGAENSRRPLRFTLYGYSNCSAVITSTVPPPYPYDTQRGLPTPTLCHLFEFNHARKYSAFELFDFFLTPI